MLNYCEQSSDLQSVFLQPTYLALWPGRWRARISHLTRKVILGSSLTWPSWCTTELSIRDEVTQSHSCLAKRYKTDQNGLKRYKVFKIPATTDKSPRRRREREKKSAPVEIFFSQKSELNARSVEAETELILPPAPTSRPVFSGLESGKARGPGPGCGGLPSKPLPKKVFRAFFYDTSELRLGQERRRRCLSTKHCEKLELGICGALKSLPAEQVLNLFRQSLQIF